MRVNTSQLLLGVLRIDYAGTRKPKTPTTCFRVVLVGDRSIGGDPPTIDVGLRQAIAAVGVLLNASFSKKLNALRGVFRNTGAPDECVSECVARIVAIRVAASGQLRDRLPLQPRVAPSQLGLG